MSKRVCASRAPDPDLPPLKVNPLLCKVARDHAANMARQQKMEHTLDGKTSFDRLKAAGYRYDYASENIAYGNMVSMPEVMQGWMGSPLHRKNLLNKDATEIGLGSATAKDGGFYITQVFGNPKAR